MEQKQRIAVSGCLLGLNCKYNGKSNKNEKVLSYLEGKDVVSVCPECFGGLQIPRLPAEIQGGDGRSVLRGEGKILLKSGEDVTEAFHRGSDNMVALCALLHVTEAILKENSPSCGVTHVYDGTFSGKKIEGQGLFTAKLLEKLSIPVYSEKDFPLE